MGGENISGKESNIIKVMRTEKKKGIHGSKGTDPNLPMANT